jgi:hypothetical protein
VRKAEKAGQDIEVFKKAEHGNKQHLMEGRKMAQLINEEEDRMRT